MKRLVVLALLVSACARMAPEADLRPPEGMLHPLPRPGAAPPPPADATTAEAFDTTTATRPPRR
jgi:hypothetical protein